ncbi:hypothetical protein GMORB2_0173 [Geosmithia morbida]|uniref:Uncharacterized protein n=1 Tax=Geosmithia morbida TaxID=1094350 RepID=A0A9P5D4T2_9HYPO|nr:uncharacterized protein GMORB2_0173 [Geosmithia morbida]KAF4126437.1 hypothetical protein GMORB2_0173 [Geosmithia morbida]
MLLLFILALCIHVYICMICALVLFILLLFWTSTGYLSFQLAPEPPQAMPPRGPKTGSSENDADVFGEHRSASSKVVKKVRSPAKKTLAKSAAKDPSTPPASKAVKKRTTFTSRPPTADERRLNGRVPGRSLIPWTRPRMAEKLLLNLLFELGRVKTHIPWDVVAHRLHPGSSASAITQYTNRLRRDLLAEGHIVPPINGRNPTTTVPESEIRGWVRDESEGASQEAIRPVTYDEEMEDRKYPLPCSYAGRDEEIREAAFPSPSESYNFSPRQAVPCSPATPSPFAPLPASSQTGPSFSPSRSPSTRPFPQARSDGSGSPSVPGNERRRGGATQGWPHSTSTGQGHSYSASGWLKVFGSMGTGDLASNQFLLNWNSSVQGGAIQNSAIQSRPAPSSTAQVSPLGDDAPGWNRASAAAVSCSEREPSSSFLGAPTAIVSPQLPSMLSEPAGELEQGASKLFGAETRPISDSIVEGSYFTDALPDSQPEFCYSFSDEQESPSGLCGMAVQTSHWSPPSGYSGAVPDQSSGGDYAGEAQDITCTFDGLFDDGAFAHDAFEGCDSIDSAD